jgi:hypothetical protein
MVDGMNMNLTISLNKMDYFAGLLSTLSSAIGLTVTSDEIIRKRIATYVLILLYKVQRIGYPIAFDKSLFDTVDTLLQTSNSLVEPDKSTEPAITDMSSLSNYYKRYYDVNMDNMNNEAKTLVNKLERFLVSIGTDTVYIDDTVSRIQGAPVEDNMARYIDPEFDISISFPAAMKSYYTTA